MSIRRRIWRHSRQLATLDRRTRQLPAAALAKTPRSRPAVLHCCRPAIGVAQRFVLLYSRRGRFAAVVGTQYRKKVSNNNYNIVVRESTKPQNRYENRSHQEKSTDTFTRISIVSRNVPATVLRRAIETPHVAAVVVFAASVRLYRTNAIRLHLLIIVYVQLRLTRVTRLRRAWRREIPEVIDASTQQQCPAPTRVPIFTFVFLFCFCTCFSRACSVRYNRFACFASSRRSMDSTSHAKSFVAKWMVFGVAVLCSLAVTAAFYLLVTRYGANSSGGMRKKNKNNAGRCKAGAANSIAVPGNVNSVRVNRYKKQMYTRLLLIPADFQKFWK